MIKQIYGFIMGNLACLAASAQLTPVQSIGLRPVAVEVPAIFQSSFPAGYYLNLPPGFGARIFYAGTLSKPRFLSFNAAGVLHVADYTSGKVFALPDANKDGIADTLIEAASGFSFSHDVKFYNNNMYVTEEQKVWKLADADNDGIYEHRELFIDSIGKDAVQPTGGHRTRTLVFDSVHQKVYLSVGSSCNVCRETFRACIEQYNIDGSGRRVFASGVRNAVGLAMHPVTHRLWANNNGSDWQGTSIPPEWIDIVRENGFYGHPFAYGSKTYFNFNTHPDYQSLLPITAADSARVNTMIRPAAQIEAHSAPMALTFLNGSFPQFMQHGIITALHGSWNTPNDYSGYKLMYLHLNDAQDSTADYAANFCTGFITDTVNRIFWGRPVGLAINTAGSIFVSSDEGNKFIMEIYRTQATGLLDQFPDQQAHLYPNPAGAKFFLAGNHNQSSLRLFDLLGKEHFVTTEVQGSLLVIDSSLLPEGLYYCVVADGSSPQHYKLVIDHRP